MFKIKSAGTAVKLTETQLTLAPITNEYVYFSEKLLQKIITKNNTCVSNHLRYNT